MRIVNGLMIEYRVLTIQRCARRNLPKDITKQEETVWVKSIVSRYSVS